MLGRWSTDFCCCWRFPWCNGSRAVLWSRVQHLRAIARQSVHCGSRCLQIGWRTSLSAPSAPFYVYGVNDGCRVSRDGWWLQSDFKITSRSMAHQAISRRFFTSHASSFLYTFRLRRTDFGVARLAIIFKGRRCVLAFSLMDRFLSEEQGGDVFFWLLYSLR